MSARPRRNRKTARAQAAPSGGHRGNVFNIGAYAGNSPGAGSHGYQTQGALALAGSPDAAPMLHAVPTPSVPELLANAVAQWRSEIAASIGVSPLDDFRALGPNLLELTTAHPSGAAQLLAGRVTRLGTLFRDPAGLEFAAAQADLVRTYLHQQASTHGAASAYLAYGVASWHEASEPISSNDDDGAEPVASIHALATATGATVPVPAVVADGAATRGAARPPKSREVRVPVLLHPINIEARPGGEYELALEGAPFINPVFAARIRAAGGLLDPVTLAAATQTLSPQGVASFAPMDALARLDALGQAVLERFELVRRQVVGGFTHPGFQALADLAELAPGLEQHDVVRALAGDGAASSSLMKAKLPQFAPCGPLGDRGVGDLSPTQQCALAAVGSGASVYVDAPIGANPEPLVAAVLADAAARGKSVLYVSGQRRVAESVKRQLAALDLDGLVLDAPAGANWRGELNRRLLTAMNVDAPGADQLTRRDELVGVYTQLDNYVKALHQVRAPWGVSIYQAFRKVAELTAGQCATGVRFTPNVLANLLLARRAQLGTELIAAAHHGAFRRETALSPWYGAHVSGAAHALASHNRVSRLAADYLPKLLDKVAYVAEASGLRTAGTVDEFGELLAMLGGMRGTLDMFQPRVFERSVANLIEATSPRKERQAASTSTQGALEVRRLRKHARDMVRPGVRVNDLTGALRKVESQREVWASYAARPGWPVLPPGLAEIEELFEAVRIDLAALERVLDGTTTSGSLTSWPLLDLLSHLRALAADRETLDHLPARERALRELRSAGLADLVADLTAREVPEQLVTAELDLAWWGSLLQTLLDQEPAFAATEGPRLRELTARFQALDSEQAVAAGAEVRRATQARLAEALAGGALGSLYTSLVADQPPPVSELVSVFGSQPHLLRPVFMAAPALVPHLLPATRCVDLVLLDGVSKQNLADLVPAIARGRQIVVVGDRRAASGDAVGQLADVLPRVSLDTGGSRRDGYLTKLLASHGYSGELHGAPLPRAACPVTLEQVDGRCLPDPVTGAPRSPEAEVTRVVELAIEHAKYRPGESLAIITLTAAHAATVASRLTAAIAADRTLAGYFGSNQPEPVVVAAASDVAGLQRDTTIFSLGLGRTPHGRVLHEFGPLAGPAGPALLNGALGVARRRAHVITSFGAGDLEPERLRGEGASYLLELLSLGAPRLSRAANPSRGLAETNNLLLAEVGALLKQRGLLVEYSYGCRGGQRLPMVVGHPSLPAERLVAVLDDGPEYAAEPSLRVRDRHQVLELERLGWLVTQVWSVAAFLDPAAEANRIAALVGEALEERLSGRNETAPVPVIPMHTIPDPAPSPAAPVLDEYIAPVATPLPELREYIAPRLA